MRKCQLLKLGTECRDKATGLNGTLTHWFMNMSGRVDYLFQPKGLNGEGQPIKKICLCLERLDVNEDDFETIDVPFEVLGTKVSDTISGFTGMAVQFIRHINGCLHVEIQPPGILPAKGTPIQSCEFDFRACVGDKIPTLTESERKESETTTPSPEEYSVPTSHTEQSLLCYQRNAQ